MLGDNRLCQKKNLLNESQVRQFMKLASLEPLTPGFVRGLTEKAAFKKGQETEAGGKADESPPPKAAQAQERAAARPLKRKLTRS